jgi:nicotinate-nucleotide pyrophosphorylase (carboxylating)
MELAEALKTDVDYILLDNMPRKSIEEAVKMRRRMGVEIPLEVSGRVNIDNVREYAETGVERISVGCLTHDAPSLDISLDIVA